MSFYPPPAPTAGPSTLPSLANVPDPLAHGTPLRLSEEMLVAYCGAPAWRKPVIKQRLKTDQPYDTTKRQDALELLKTITPEVGPIPKPPRKRKPKAAPSSSKNSNASTSTFPLNIDPPAPKRQRKDKNKDVSPLNLPSFPHRVPPPSPAFKKPGASSPSSSISSDSTIKASIPPSSYAPSSKASMTPSFSGVSSPSDEHRSSLPVAVDNLAELLDVLDKIGKKVAKEGQFARVGHHVSSADRPDIVTLGQQLLTMRDVGGMTVGKKIEIGGKLVHYLTSQHRYSPLPKYFEPPFAFPRVLRSSTSPAEPDAHYLGSGSKYLSTLQSVIDHLGVAGATMSEWKKNGEVALVLIGTWYRSEAVRLKSKIEVEKGE